ncbi:hypothetical protein VNO78_28931 [Psophocarpus tetragonolobus]|uniref:Uncharacterized protein n=1 Tax=Psophocarpus tetragonolobus TaxID=3891 RepID=A0AAN9RU62_PSOTE
MPPLAGAAMVKLAREWRMENGEWRGGTMTLTRHEDSVVVIVPRGVKIRGNLRYGGKGKAKWDKKSGGYKLRGRGKVGKGVLGLKRTKRFASPSPTALGWAPLIIYACPSL